MKHGSTSGITLAIAALLSGCGGDSNPQPGETTPPATTWFTDATDEVELDFLHRNGGSGRKYLVETNGSGAAWLDADGDGQLDLFLVQGAPLPGWEGPLDARNRLFRQVDGRFEDITESSGLGDEQHGMGAAAADWDNDGDPDLCVTNYGVDLLYRNDDGKFTDVTEETIGRRDQYSSACTFADLDKDGHLDLFIVGYVNWSLENNPKCGEPERGDDYLSYCHPEMFEGIDDRLYRNLGNGTFEDVSERAGLLGSRGKGLGVATSDFDRDGDLDLFVANDSTENHCWRNDGGLRLVDIAVELGVAYNGSGSPEACMGCDFGDIDGDLDFDLFTVNLAGETNTLWVSEGSRYRDRSFPSGLAAPSENLVGFGTALVDLNLDGHLDVAIANGHVLDNASLFDRKTTYRQTAQIFQGNGEGRFELVPPTDAGGYFGERFVGRGLALADFDEDGDLDLLFTNNHGPAVLLRNHASSRSWWIGFDLEGSTGNRDALGSEILIEAGGRRQIQTVRSGSSYLCSHDHRVLFGLAKREGSPPECRAEIRWPDGQITRLEELEPDRYHHVREPDNP